MIELQLKPTIYSYDTCRDFAAELQLGAKDLIITNQYIFDPNFKELDLPCHVLSKKNTAAGNRLMRWLKPFIGTCLAM